MPGPKKIETLQFDYIYGSGRNSAKGEGEVRERQLRREKGGMEEGFILAPTPRSVAWSSECRQGKNNAILPEAGWGASPVYSQVQPIGRTTRKNQAVLFHSSHATLEPPLWPGIPTPTGISPRVTGAGPRTFLA